MVRKNQTSKEFRRHDDSIPYLDNAKFILFRTTQNGSRLSSEDFESQVLVHMNDRQVIVNLPYHVLSFIVVGDIHHFIKVTLQKEKTVHVHE